MQFSDLKLASPILRAAKGEGYVTATPIQAQAIPHIMEGRDVLGSAQTGTGKTAAFAMPILHRLAASGATGAAKARHIRCLVLCPTRELASQISESFRTYGRELSLRNTVIFGGVSQNRQVQALRQGVDILVATPGRLLDLLNQRLVDLRGVEVLVLDEADRMLDMGFIRDIRTIIQTLPPTRQALLFSATMPPEIRKLAGSILRNPVTVQVATEANAGERVQDCVYFVQKHDKPALLAHLVDELPMSRAIVFTRTKHGADKVVRHLHQRGIKAEAIHGNKSQNARQRALANFSGNKIPVLVATDIASRGIDVDGITHVVNYDLTHEPETYVHRIGRSARAGASGAAVSFCDREERAHLKAIEKLIRRAIPVKESQLPATAPRHEEAAERPHMHQPRRPAQPATQPRRAPGRQSGRGVRHAGPAPRRRGR
jgi:ATP-dependent RNA helicase RhlE